MAQLPPTSPFAGDDGSADPALAEALARLAAGTTDLAHVVRVLAGTRVLVPVLAVEHDDAEDEDRHADAHAHADACAVGHERRASAGVVAVAAPDGRTALPVFTCVDALTAWHPTARPMPAEAPRAAVAALAEGWDLLVLDPGGPHTAVLPRPAVHALAAGRAWEPAVAGGVVRAEVVAAVRRAAAWPGGVDVVPGRAAEVAVVVTLEPGLTREALERTLAALGARLAADEAVPAAVDSLELRPVAPAPQRAGGPAARPAVSDAAAAPARRRGLRRPGRPGRP